jgi:Aldehyde dehydrogenase family
VNWTESRPRVAQRLDASAVMVNDHTAFLTDWMPFAGQRQSGYGIGGIPWSMREMTQEKMVVLRHADSGNPVHRECLAAAANGDINQCLAQGRDIDSVRRAVQGMAVRFTAAPGFATAPEANHASAAPPSCPRPLSSLKTGPTRQQVLPHLYQRIIDTLPHTPYVFPRREILPEDPRDVFQDRPPLSHCMATRPGVQTLCSTRDDGPCSFTVTSEAMRGEHV